MPTIKNVFVIGNGFDLSLGLPTSYTDFLKSNFFTENIGTSELFRYLHEKASIEKWVDIEAELANISKNGNKDPNFLSDYKRLCDSLTDYIKSIDINKINRDSPAYKLLSTHYKPSESYIANFNYTNTVQFILKELSVEAEDIDGSVHHIHGECHRRNIIFGVDDRARIHPDHVFLYKSTANHDGGRGIKGALRDAKRIFFFGHSLGESDHMYLEDLFLKLGVSENNVELHFYHYGETGLHELHKQLHKLTSHNVSQLKSNSIFQASDTSLSAKPCA